MQDLDENILTEAQIEAGHGKTGFPPWYGARMRGKAVNLPPSMHQAIRDHGGSAWVRHLIARALEEEKAGKD